MYLLHLQFQKEKSFVSDRLSLAKYEANIIQHTQNMMDSFPGKL
jgi:hypothetical protein